MSEPMNEGVRILIERMKTNPEEFRMEEGSMYSDNKWSRLIHSAVSSEVFTKEESDAVRNALVAARREIFTGDVMRTLTTDGDNLIKAEWVSSAVAKTATQRNLLSTFSTTAVGNGIISNQLYNTNGVTSK